ncbi:MAG: hypothetical protein M3R15_11670 [Acidobacteriota bacterium]|nr:hypothetical protein [Acidobacteriota bacterium]
MTEHDSSELAQVTQDVYAAREAFSEAAQNYDAALDRYITAWQQYESNLSASDLPHVAAVGKPAIYENQIVGAKEHKEMLGPIIEYFN